MFGVDQDFDWSYAYQTNVGVQREITTRAGRGATYIGTFNRNLPLGRDVNYPVVNATATDAAANVLSRRPNPAFGQVLMLDSDQYSNYNSLQLTFNMRQWHNVSANGYYTLSKTMSSAELHNNTTQGGAQNFTRLADEYGRADTDQRHVFSASVNWEIDYYNGSNRHFGAGCSTAGASRRSSSCAAACRLPSPTATSTPTSMARPTIERGRLAIPKIDNPRRSAGSIPPRSCRTPVVTGVATDGNALRNQLDGPGFKVVDLAVSRRFQAAASLHADLPRRSDQRVQHRQLRPARQQRAVRRDVHDLWGHPHRQCDAPASAGRAPVLLSDPFDDWFAER